MRLARMQWSDKPGYINVESNCWIKTYRFPIDKKTRRQRWAVQGMAQIEQYLTQIAECSIHRQIRPEQGCQLLSRVLQRCVHGDIRKQRSPFLVGQAAPLRAWTLQGKASEQAER